MKLRLRLLKYRLNHIQDTKEHSESSSASFYILRKKLLTKLNYFV